MHNAICKKATNTLNRENIQVDNNITKKSSIALINILLLIHELRVLSIEFTHV